MKNLSLPITVNFEENSINSQSDLQKCRIKVCKEGLVPSHGLYITQEAIEGAIETIFNKPLLCSYVIDDKGNKIEFKGHDIEYKLENGQYKRIYIEQPVGVIPESCNYEFDEDGYFCVDGYIFKKYCEEVVSIIQNDCNEKDVSMETEILEETYDEEKKISYINKLKFTGITFLDGYKHQASIDGCNVQLFEKNENFMKEFSKLIERVNKLEKEKEGFDLSRQEIINKYSAFKNNENFEKIIKNTNLSDEELEKELFSMSNNDLERRIREELASQKIIVKDYWGDSYEDCKYYLDDVLTEENIVILEDSQNWRLNYGVPYSVEGDKVTLDYPNAKRYIRGDWRPYEDGMVEPIINPNFEEFQKKITDKITNGKTEFEKTQNELSEVKSNYTDLLAEKEVLDNKVIELEKKVSELELVSKEFAKHKAEDAKVEKEAEANAIFEQFQQLQSIEGYSEIFEKRFELSNDELTTKLKVFAYDNRDKIKENPKKEENFEKKGFLKVGNDPKNKETLSEAEKRYGFDTSKYEL